MLSIDKVRNSEYSKVSVLGSGITFTGILQNDIGVSGGNDFDTKFLGSDLLDTVTSKKAELQRTVTRVTGGAAGADVSGTIQELTKLNWTGSKKPMLSVQVILVALKDDQANDVVRKHLEIMRTVFPNKKGGFFIAPLGYNPGNGAGTLSLKIGKWFHARALVMRDARFTFSRICLKSGRPMFALGQIEMEPYRAITFSEFRSYFKV